MNGLEFWEHYEQLVDESYDDTVHELNEQRFELHDDEHDDTHYELILTIHQQHEAVVKQYVDEEISIYL